MRRTRGCVLVFWNTFIHKILRNFFQPVWQIAQRVSPYPLVQWSRYSNLGPCRRRCYISATYKNNAEANGKAHDLNQKTIQALDALAEDYLVSEATMANVTSEHEAGDAIHAASAETAGELERIQKDQGRLQDDLDFQR